MPARAGSWWSQLGRIVRRLELPTLASAANFESLLGELVGKLDEQNPRGPCITVGLPQRSPEWQAKWFGRRLVFWPHGVTTTPTSAVLSSRLGRDLSKFGQWFELLRGVLQDVDPKHESLVTVLGTTADRWIVRGAAQRDMPLLRMEPPAGRGNRVSAWLRGIRSWYDDPTRADSIIRVSALIHPDLAEEHSEIPFADRLLVTWAAKLYVIRVRPSGAMRRLVSSLISTGMSGRECEVRLAEIDPPAIPPALLGPWLENGAIRWRPAPRVAVPPGEVPPDVGPASGYSSLTRPASVHARVVAPAEWTKWDLNRFLIHGTRAATGPWPDQSENEFLDGWLGEGTPPDRSALATLTRIVQGEMILATSQGIRGSWSVVSFTAVPLAERNRWRTYRVHRGRWDFEPYGVCVSRDWLQQRGTRPVLYGDEATWRSLEESDRMFFQPARSLGRKSKSCFDWTVEREWRHPGDVNLQQATADEVLVFVPTPDEAARLAPVSRWPVLVLDESLHERSSGEGAKP